MNINNFGPFSSNVWGTVSDWVMVIVTGTTLYYINKTFKSQYEVQKLQQQSTNIENEKFRIQVLPTFELFIYKTDFEFIEDKVKTKMSIGFHLMKNECLNLEIDFSITSSEIISNDIALEKLDYIAEDAHRGLDIVLSTKKHIFDRNGCSLSLNFKYADIVGNRYEMQFYANVTYVEKQVVVSGPFRLLKNNVTS